MSSLHRHPLAWAAGVGVCGMILGSVGGHASVSTATDPTVTVSAVTVTTATSTTTVTPRLSPTPAPTVTVTEEVTATVTVPVEYADSGVRVDQGSYEAAAPRDDGGIRTAKRHGQPGRPRCSAVIPVTGRYSTGTAMASRASERFGSGDAPGIIE